MDEKTKQYIQCLIENVGLNATRHQDQKEAMKEATKVMEKIEKLFSIPLVSKSFYSDDAIARLKTEYFEKGLKANE